MTWTTSTPTGITNVHRRRVTDIDAAWALVHRVMEPGANVWPEDSWEPMRLDNGIAVGSKGGHGAVRYTVTVADDTRVRFDLTIRQLRGFHEFRREGSELVHELVIEDPSILVRVLLIPMHDAVLEDLLDNVEDHLAGRPVPRARKWRPLVRFLRLFEPRANRTRDHRNPQAAA